MLQDPNVERYVKNAIKPLKKEIEQMKAQIEALNQALRIHDVVGRSEQLPILDRCGCEEPNEEPIKVCMNCNGYVE